MERQEFLRNVRQRLGRRQGPPPPPPRWQPPRELFHEDSSVRTRAFVEQATLQGAKVAKVPNRAEARKRVEALLKERGWARVVADPEARWKGSAADWVEDPLAADFGLCEAERALASPARAAPRTSSSTFASASTDPARSTSG
jgi:hypothetical protein